MDWSPDGRWIVMTNPYGSVTNVYLMRSVGGELFLVGSSSEPSWRPTSG
jgi:Tol biopolymer transport system component